MKFDLQGRRTDELHLVLDDSVEPENVVTFEDKNAGITLTVGLNKGRVVLIKIPHADYKASNQLLAAIDTVSPRVVSGAASSSGRILLAPHENVGSPPEPNLTTSPQK